MSSSKSLQNSRDTCQSPQSKSPVVFARSRLHRTDFQAKVLRLEGTQGLRTNGKSNSCKSCKFLWYFCKRQVNHDHPINLYQSHSKWSELLLDQAGILWILLWQNGTWTWPSRNPNYYSRGLSVELDVFLGTWQKQCKRLQKILQNLLEEPDLTCLSTVICLFWILPHEFLPRPSCPQALSYRN